MKMRKTQVLVMLFIVFSGICVCHAGNRFLTLPLQKETVVGNGWEYNGTDGTHCAIDYFTEIGTPVVAAADGYAVADTQIIEGADSYGNLVVIMHDEKDEEGKNYFTLYAHLQSYDSNIPKIPGGRQYAKQGLNPVEKNWKKVSRGQIIGYSGISGLKYPWPHLHFSVFFNWYYRCSMNELDPYDLYKATTSEHNSSDYYPPKMSKTIGSRTRSSGSVYQSCGDDRLWVSDPPKPYEPEVNLSSFFTRDFDNWESEGFSEIHINDNGWIVGTPGTDPKLYSSFMMLDPSSVTHLQIYGRNNTDNNQMEVFLWTDVNGHYRAEESTSITFPNDNKWHLIQKGVSDLAGWSQAGTIHGIRIDPVKNGNSGEIFIDYIRLRKQRVQEAAPTTQWHPDGTLIKTADSPDVYFLENKKKRAIPDEATFTSLNFDWCNIITVSSQEMNNYPQGPDMEYISDRVIRRSGTNECGKAYVSRYLVKGSHTRRWLACDSVFSALGFDTGDIEDVGSAVFNAFDEGPPVTSIYPEGTVIKVIGDSRVYIISNGQARPFADEPAYSALGYSTAHDDGDGLWESIIEINEFPRDIAGPAITSGILLTGNSSDSVSVSMITPDDCDPLPGNSRRTVNYTVDHSGSVGTVVIKQSTDGKCITELVTDKAPVNSQWTWQLPDVTTNEAVFEVTAYDDKGRPYTAYNDAYLSIEGGLSANQDFFTIHNDGGVDLRIDEITLENGGPWTSWITSLTLHTDPQIVLNEAGPTLMDDIVVSPNQGLRVDIEVDKAGLATGVYAETIQIHSDDPDNPVAAVAVQLEVAAESEAPGPPTGIIVSPAGWSSSNTFSVDWTDPDDPSGIVGGYYKYGAPPTHNTDGIWFDADEKPIAVAALIDGEYAIYIWLEDSLGNIDYNNYGEAVLKRDNSAPSFKYASPSDGSVGVPIDGDVLCSFEDELAGMDAGNVVMRINGENAAPQIKSQIDGSIIVEHNPTPHFPYDQDITIYLQVQDLADPPSVLEKTFSFRTFLENGDDDLDGVSNVNEYALGIDPMNSDSDSDGLPDGWEVDQGCNPLSSSGADGAAGDPDGNGLTNIMEYLDGQQYSADAAVLIDSVSGYQASGDAVLSVSGNGVVAYKYSLDSGTWGPETTVENPIDLSGLSDGSHQILVIGKDASGYWQGVSTAVGATWTVDTVSPQNPSLDSSIPETGSQTNQNTVVLSWVTGSDDRSGVQGYSWAVDTAPTTSPDTGVDGSTLPGGCQIGTANGEWYFHVRTVDNAGNWSSSSHYGPWTFDSVLPAKPAVDAIISPTNITPQTLSGIREAETSIWLNGEQILPADSTTSWSYDLTLAEGPNDFTITSRDAAGNISPMETISIVYDSIPPSAAVLFQAEPAVSGTPTNDASIVLTWQNSSDTGSGVDGYSWSLTQYSDTVQDTTLVGGALPQQVTTGPANGNWYLHVRTQDMAGNWTSTSHFGPWVFDDVAPVPPSLNPLATPTNEATQTISGAKESEASVWLNSMEIVPCGPSTTWSHTLNLSPGENAFSLSSRDSAGNVSSMANFSITLDQTPPSCSISYSPDSWTNTDVSATIKLSDGIVTSQGGGNIVFTSNGTHEFTFEDEAGNTGSAIAEVTWIDKTPPGGSLAWSTTSPTNQDVTVVVTPDEAATITNNGGSDTYVFTENGSFAFQLMDSVGNNGTVTASVDWIDKSAPQVVFTYDPAGPELTNQDVRATITADEEMTITNNGGAVAYTFTENGSFTFEFVDEVGNSGSATAQVDWIDKVNPIGSFTYSTTEPTNQDVVARLLTSKPTAIINNGGSDTYTFTENGEFTFEFVDNAENAGSATAVVDWIDRQVPDGLVVYSTESATNQDVVATLQTSEDVTVTNNAGSFTYTFSENGSFLFEYMDNASNSGSTTASVDWIDKVSPQGTFSYSTLEPTNQDVIAVLQPSEAITVTNNGGSDTYTFAANGTCTLEFVDVAGNAGSASATVDWIDKVSPSASVSYTPGGPDPTNQDVTATIEPDEPVTVFAPGVSNSYTFTNNGQVLFEFVDDAGNTGSVLASVDWIDKTPPTGTVRYSTTEPTNEDVIATIEIEPEVSITNNGGSASYSFSENGIFLFQLQDPAGNNGAVTAEVAWIDKQPPTWEIFYFPDNPTTGNVQAFINLSDGFITSQGGSYHEFTDNGTFEFTFQDMLGNSGAAIAAVDWIDRTPPTAEIHYQPSEHTQGIVLATLVPDELVTVTNNSGSLNYTFMENGSFTFQFEDAVGQTGQTTASVDWIIMTGDVNHDGRIDLADVILCLKIMSEADLDTSIYHAADVNGDAALGLEDALYILRMVAADAE